MKRKNGLFKLTQEMLDRATFIRSKYSTSYDKIAKILCKEYQLEKLTGRTLRNYLVDRIPAWAVLRRYDV